MKLVYLDYAAATPLDEEVKQAMEPFFSREFYNPSATYLAARRAKQELNGIRENVAKTLGVKPAEIIFTAGATEANNLAIQGIVRQLPDAEVLVSAIEHESVLAPARLFNCREIPVTKQGIVDLTRLEKMVGPKTVLVSVGYVNNELGTIQPLAEIAKILAAKRAQRATIHSAALPLYLHSDAAQAGNYLDLHVSRLGVDLLSINGGKLYGPKQSGALYIKAGIKLQPIILGGGQEMGLRSGTENVAFAAGLATALQVAQTRRAGEAERVIKLRELFETGLKNTLSRAIVNGHGHQRAPHVVSVSFPGMDNERLMMQLDEAGVQCAVGSACSAARQEASHVLAAIGLSEKMARATLRFSFGRHTTEADLNQTIKILERLINS